MLGIFWYLERLLLTFLKHLIKLLSKNVMNKKRENWPDLSLSSLLDNKFFFSSSIFSFICWSLCKSTASSSKHTKITVLLFISKTSRYCVQKKLSDVSSNKIIMYLKINCCSVHHSMVFYHIVLIAMLHYAYNLFVLNHWYEW